MLTRAKAAMITVVDEINEAFQKMALEIGKITRTAEEVMTQRMDISNGRQKLDQNKRRMGSLKVNKKKETKPIFLRILVREVFRSLKATHSPP
jgi:hypothetical protein